MARLRTSTSEVQALAAGWELGAVEPGAATQPGQLGGVTWKPAPVPGTAAQALRAAGVLSKEARAAGNRDFWYRTSVDLPRAGPGEAVVLVFEGLATLAEVWLDDERVLSTDNMFLRHEVDVTARAGVHRLAIRFGAIATALKERRPRPRWKTRLVDQQQLRFLRTTLVGHIPSWCPGPAPVGPWRPITLEHRRSLAVERADVRATPDGEGGVVRIDIALRSLGSAGVQAASVAVAGTSGKLACEKGPGGTHRISGELRVPRVERWWPHTHGSPRLYPVTVTATLADGASVELDAGEVGFRELALSTAGGGFELSVNGVPVFCRGACWTPLDVVSLQTDGPACDRALDQARAAGMNMLRVLGPMVYEDDAFYAGCARRGILVWQDFMFSNLDYPVDDPAFAASVQREAEQLLDRVQTSPALAVLCGGSEIAQQAAMMGLPPETWGSRLFEAILPAAVAAQRPDVPYVANSPWGGALPFHTNTGVSHYYGVGAYLRPLEDARRSEVRFASECLGFSNVPEERSVEEFMEGAAPHHHPLWKAGVPRDNGAGWDFEDVRDHYLQLLFGLDPVRVRSGDPARYLDLSRATSFEVMAATLAEWRRPGSTCRGALVWFYRDLVAGAGWGLTDAYGIAKAAYHGFADASQPLLLAFSDEGLNGLDVFAAGDGAAAIDAEVEVTLFLNGETPVASGTAPMLVPARGAVRLSVDTLLGRFTDSAYAYRFGPPGHDVAVATLRNRAGGQVLARAFHFDKGVVAARRAGIGLAATAVPLPGDGYQVTVRTRVFAQSVAFDTGVHVPDHAWFHLPPGGEAKVVLRGPAGSRLRGQVTALNSMVPVQIEVIDGPRVVP